jgi:hypothetical protein
MKSIVTWRTSRHASKRSSTRRGTKWALALVTQEEIVGVGGAGVGAVGLAQVAKLETRAHHRIGEVRGVGGSWLLRRDNGRISAAKAARRLQLTY